MDNRYIVDIKTKINTKINEILSFIDKQSTDTLSIKHEYKQIKDELKKNLDTNTFL